MRYVSLFSGVEAASLAWRGLPMEPLAFSEIDPFPCAVLAERFPGTPNLGDVTTIDWGPYVGAAELVVGGSPCQSFSVAGTRTGLAGASGLMFEYVRAVRELRPRWLLWENVPGALSSGHGEDFGCLLRELADLGYGLAWRVLDAQFFGVAQRRRRLFVVGSLGDGGARRACEVLLEREGLRGDPQTGREKRQALAKRAGLRTEGPGGALNGWDVQSRRVFDAGTVGPTLNSGTGEGMNIQPSVLVQAPTLMAQRERGAQPPNVSYAVRTANTSANGIGVSEELGHTIDCAGPEAVCIPENAINRPTGGTNGPMAYGPAEPSPTLRASKDVPAVSYGFKYHASAGAGTVGLEAETCPTQIAGKPPAVVTSGGADVFPTLAATDGKYQFADNQSVDSGRLVMMAANQRGEVRLEGGDGQVCGAIPASRGGKQLQAVTDGWVVRRLTPLECERLQGMPDGWTRVPYRGRPAEECPDGPRYKAIGNSMAVPVMRWIGRRILAADCLWGGADGQA